MFSLLLILHILGAIHGSSTFPPLIPRIINGSPSEVPFVLLLKQYGSTEPDYADHICSAVLIDSQYILTAAHCLDSGATTSTSVIYGCFDTRDPKCEDIPVVDWIKHPKYVDPINSCLQRQWNDIAVGKLLYHIEPLIQRPHNAPSLLRGKATLIGWGRDDSDDAGLIQQSIVLPININVKPFGSEEKIFIDHHSESFSGGYCGGPLLIDGIMHGIASASWTVKPGHELLVYMNLFHYSDFLRYAITCLSAVNG